MRHYFRLKPLDVFGMNAIEPFIGMAPLSPSPHNQASPSNARRKCISFVLRSHSHIPSLAPRRSIAQRFSLAASNSKRFFPVGPGLFEFKAGALQLEMSLHGGGHRQKGSRLRLVQLPRLFVDHGQNAELDPSSEQQRSSGVEAKRALRSQSVEISHHIQIALEHRLRNESVLLSAEWQRPAARNLLKVSGSPDAQNCRRSRTDLSR